MNEFISNNGNNPNNPKPEEEANSENDDILAVLSGEVDPEDPITR